MLFFGLAQALGDRPPPTAGDRTRAASRSDRRSDAGPGFAAVNAARSSGASVETRRAAVTERAAEPRGEPPPALLRPASVDWSTAGTDREIAAPAPSAPVPAPTPDLGIVERCAGLYLDGELDELLAELGPQVSVSDASSAGASSQALTALASIEGLARRDRADVLRARTAFQTAIGSLPDPVSGPCPPRLAALSVCLARRLLDAIDRSPEA